MTLPRRTVHETVCQVFEDINVVEPHGLGPYFSV